MELWETPLLAFSIASGRIQEGIQKGIQEGRQEGEAALLLRLLEHKFGRVDPKTRKRVQSADAERLLDWGERVLTAERLEDVFEN